MMIAVAALNEDGRIRTIFGVHFTADINEMNALADVPSGLFNGAVAVDVAELTEAETASVIARIGKAIDGHLVCVTLKYLADPTV